MSGAVWDIKPETTEIVISCQTPVLLWPSRTKHSLGNVVLLMAHHLQRWPNDETTSVWCFLPDSSLMSTPPPSVHSGTLYPWWQAGPVQGYSAATPNDPLINPSTSRWVCRHNHVLQQIRWADNGLMLGQRRRLWSSIKPALAQRLFLHV